MSASAAWHRSQPSRCSSVASRRRAGQLAVEVCGEQRQVRAAGLRQALRVDLDEPKFRPQALAGAEDQLRDGVLLHPDELADLRVAAILELPEGEHEPLARLQPAVGDAHFLLLPLEQRASLGIVLDRASAGLAPAPPPSAPLACPAPPASGTGSSSSRRGRPGGSRSPGRGGRAAGAPGRTSPGRDRPRRGRCRQPVGEPAQPRLVLRVQLVPRRPVAGLKPADEISVGRRHRRRHRRHLAGRR